MNIPSPWPAPVIDYRRTFRFGVGREELWRTIEAFPAYEGWWGWLHDFTADGAGLVAGTVLRGTIAPPVPYRMRVQVHLDRCCRAQTVEATVGGDLRGRAVLRLDDDGPGTSATVSWSVEMMQRPMRLAARVSYPLLRWGHDRVVDMTVAGFRQRAVPEGRSGIVGR